MSVSTKKPMLGKKPRPPVPLTKEEKIAIRREDQKRRLLANLAPPEEPEDPEEPESGGTMMGMAPASEPVSPRKEPAPIIPVHVSANTAAKRLRVSPTTILLMVARDQLRTVKIGQRVRIIEESLNDLISKA